MIYLEFLNTNPKIYHMIKILLCYTDMLYRSLKFFCLSITN